MSIEIFTDGSCRGNPGPGGWAALIKNLDTGGSEVLRGGEEKTTNNIMELTAVIKALICRHWLDLEVSNAMNSGRVGASYSKVVHFRQVRVTGHVLRLSFYMNVSKNVLGRRVEVVACFGHSVVYHETLVKR